MRNSGDFGRIKWYHSLRQFQRQILTNLHFERMLFAYVENCASEVFTKRRLHNRFYKGANHNDRYIHRKNRIKRLDYQE